jgi:DNA-binding beta-propeller fold protein YncE
LTTKTVCAPESVRMCCKFCLTRRFLSQIEKERMYTEQVMNSGPTASHCLIFVFILISSLEVVSATSTSFQQYHVATLTGLADSPSDVFIDPSTNAAYFVSNALHYIGRVALPASCGIVVNNSSATVSVVAGVSGTPSFEDGDGTVATFSNPFSITGDGNGTFYVGDTNNNRIRIMQRHVNRSYTVSTLAGSGASGSTNDFGVWAEFDRPCGVALSPSHLVLYVCDLGNNALRRITLSSARVDTLVSDTAATPIDGPMFIVASPDGQWVYFSDSQHHRVGKVSTVSVTGITTVAGAFSYSGLVDNVNGLGVALLKTPEGLAITPDASLLVMTDADAHTVRVVRLRDSATISIVGNGTAVAQDSNMTAAYMSDPVPACNSPKGITLWKHDNSSFQSLLWVDYGANAIRCLEVASTNTNIFPSQLLPADGSLVNQVVARRVIDTNDVGGVGDLYVHPTTGAVFVTMYFNDSVVRCNVSIGTNALPSRAVGGCEYLVVGEDVATGARGSSVLSKPYGITGDLIGHVLYVGEFGGRRVRMINLTTNVVSTVAGSGVDGFDDGPGAAARFCGPAGVVLNPVTNVLYVADSCSVADSNPQIRKVNLSSELYEVTTVTAPGVGHIRINFMIMTPDYQHLFLTSPTSNLVLRLSLHDEITIVVAGDSTSPSSDGFGGSAQFSSPQSIALHGDEVGWPCLYVLESSTGSMREIRLRDQYVRTISVTGTPPGPFGVQGMVPFYNATSLEFGFMVGTLERDVYFIPLGRRSTFSLTTSIRGNTFSGSLSRSLSPSTTMSSTSTSSLTRIVSTSLDSPTLTISLSTASRSRTTLSSSLSSVISVSRRNPSLSTSVMSHSLRTIPPTTSPQILTKPSGTPSKTNLSISLSASLPTTTSHCGCSGSVNGGVLMITGGCILCNMSVGSASSVVVLASSAASNTATQREGTLKTTAVSRDTLMHPSAQKSVLFSVTLRMASGLGASCWTVPSVSLSGLALSIYTTHVFDVDGAAVLELLLMPPHHDDSGTWLPSDFGTYIDTHLLLNISLTCNDEKGLSASFLLLHVPCPGRRRVLAGEVSRAVDALQWVTVVSGPGASSSVARIAAMRSMQMCGGGFMSGIVQVSTNACDSDDDNAAGAGGEAGGEARDGITGNMVVIASCITIGAALCWLIASCSPTAYSSKSPWLVAMRMIALPSCFTPVLVVTLPTTAGLSFVLLAGPGSIFCGVDILLGLLGTLIALTVTGAPLILWQCSVGRLEVRAETDHTKAAAPKKNGVSTVVQRWWIARQWEIWMSIQRHWHQVDLKGSFSSEPPDSASQNDEAAPGWDRHVAVVLHEYHILWYFAIDTVVLFVAGLLVGVTQSFPDASVCGVCGIIVAVMYSAQLVLCCKLRPFTSMFGNLHGLLVLTLSSVSALLQATHIVLISSNPSYASEHASTLDQVMVGSAVCDLMVMGISAVRAAMDVIEVTLTIKRLSSSLSSRATQPHTGPLMISKELGGNDLPSLTHGGDDGDFSNASFNINMESSDDEKGEVSQSRFWDDDGMAMALLEEIAEEVIRPAAEEKRPDQYNEMLQAPVVEVNEPTANDVVDLI